jgi:hypothetical protein
MARSAIVPPLGEDVEAWLASRCLGAMAAMTLPIRREVEGIGKIVDVRKYLVSATVGGAEARQALVRAGIVGDLVTLDVLAAITGSGAAKSSEFAAVLCGEGGDAPPHRSIRLELYGMAGETRVSPLDLLAFRRPQERPASPKERPTAAVLIADAE